MILLNFHCRWTFLCNKCIFRKCIFRNCIFGKCIFRKCFFPKRIFPKFNYSKCIFAKYTQLACLLSFACEHFLPAHIMTFYEWPILCFWWYIWYFDWHIWHLAQNKLFGMAYFIYMRCVFCILDALNLMFDDDDCVVYMQVWQTRVLAV